MENKEDLINNILDKSDSQKDRENLGNTKSHNLVNFLNSQIEKSTAKNDLRNDVIEKLKKKVSDKDDQIPTIVLIRLLEILEKADNDLTLGIFNSMEKAALFKILTGEKESGKNSSLDFNKEDVDKVKKLLNYISQLDIIEGN